MLEKILGITILSTILGTSIWFVFSAMYAFIEWDRRYITEGVRLMISTIVLTFFLLGITVLSYSIVE